MSNSSLINWVALIFSKNLRQTPRKFQVSLTLEPKRLKSQLGRLTPSHSGRARTGFTNFAKARSKYENSLATSPRGIPEKFKNRPRTFYDD